MKKDSKDKFGLMPSREVAVLLEDIRGDFRLFGEKLTSVEGKVDLIFKEQGRLREEVFLIKADINVIKGEIKEIKTRLDRIEERLGHVEVDLRIVKTDFGKRLTTLEAAK